MHLNFVTHLTAHVNRFFLTTDIHVLATLNGAIVFVWTLTAKVMEKATTLPPKVHLNFVTHLTAHVNLFFLTTDIHNVLATLNGAIVFVWTLTAKVMEKGIY